MQKSRLELLRLQTMMVLWKQTRNRTIIDVEFENPALSVTVQSYRLLTHTLRLRGESPFPRGSRIARFSDDVPRLQRQAATAYLETHLVTRFDLQIFEFLRFDEPSRQTGEARLHVHLPVLVGVLGDDLGLDVGLPIVAGDALRQKLDLQADGVAVAAARVGVVAAQRDAAAVVVVLTAVDELLPLPLFPE